VEIHRSARKHRIADEDIRYAVDHAIYAGDVEDGLPLRVLYLGPNRSGNLLEIIVIQRDDGTDLVIHAMKMRNDYEELLPKELSRD
jgi:hypothetical protein